MADDGWKTGGATDAEATTLAVIAGAQFSLRVSENLKDSKKRQRFDTARFIVNGRAAVDLRSAGVPDNKLALNRNNTHLLKNAFCDEDRLGLVINALLGNPIQPFQIAIDEESRLAATEAFAADLGCPATWVPAITKAVRDARKSHASLAGLMVKAGLGALGLVIVFAAPFLVPIIAPVGLAGGAALVAGLAALGPGGMLGGLAMVAGVAAAGGAGVAASSLVAGNRTLVQQNVVFIQAMALAKGNLRPHSRSRDELRTLEAMRKELNLALARHKRVDDKPSGAAKEIREKIGDIETALSMLRKSGLGGA
ncbi:MAG TPA: hypothetical protein VFC82_01735 [Actinomycetaceae bacterium]|nr:hypothetical protein [Actinomycetaceae bacterium]